MSLQGVTPLALAFIQETSCKLFVNKGSVEDRDISLPYIIPYISEIAISDSPWFLYFQSF